MRRVLYWSMSSIDPTCDTPCDFLQVTKFVWTRVEKMLQMMKLCNQALKHTAQIFVTQSSKLCLSGPKSSPADKGARDHSKDKMTWTLVCLYGNHYPQKETLNPPKMSLNNQHFTDYPACALTSCSGLSFHLCLKAAIASTVPPPGLAPQARWFPDDGWYKAFRSKTKHSTIPFQSQQIQFQGRTSMFKIHGDTCHCMFME